MVFFSPNSLSRSHRQGTLTLVSIKFNCPRWAVVFCKMSRFRCGKFNCLYFKKWRKLSLYCLQFYIRLGPKSPLDERQIMEDR
jgi:hypothetical protein